MPTTIVHENSADPSGGFFVVPSDSRNNSNNSNNSNNKTVEGSVLVASNKYGKVVWGSIKDAVGISDLSGVEVTGQVGPSDTLMINSGGAWTNKRLTVSDLGDVNVASISNGDTLKFNNGVWVPSTISAAGVRDLNGQSGMIQKLKVGSRGFDVEVVSKNNIHTVNVPTASSSSRGVLSPDDYIKFDEKMTGQLSHGNVWIGSSGSLPVQKRLSGDVSLVANGKVALAETGVAPGTYKCATITVDAKGRVTEASGGTPGSRSVNGDTSSDIIIKTMSETGEDVSVSVLDSDPGTVVINVPTASSSSRGALSPEDFAVFNSKLDSEGAQPGEVAVASSSGRIRPIPISGDAIMSDRGILTLKNVGVVPGMYSSNASFMVDSKGRITEVDEMAILPVSLDVTDVSEADISVHSRSAAHGETLAVNIPTASSSSRGALSSEDFDRFSSKLDRAGVQPGHFYVGGGDGVLTERTLHGDASLDSSGGLELETVLPESGARTYLKPASITVDAKGRVIGIADAESPATDANSLMIASPDGTATSTSSLAFEDDSFTVLIVPPHIKGCSKVSTGSGLLIECTETLDMMCASATMASTAGPISCTAAGDATLMSVNGDATLMSINGDANIISKHGIGLTIDDYVTTFPTGENVPQGSLLASNTVVNSTTGATFNKLHYVPLPTGIMAFDGSAIVNTGLGVGFPGELKASSVSAPTYSRLDLTEENAKLLGRITKVTGSSAVEVKGGSTGSVTVSDAVTSLVSGSSHVVVSDSGTSVQTTSGVSIAAGEDVSISGGDVRITTSDSGTFVWPNSANPESGSVMRITGSPASGVYELGMDSRSYLSARVSADKRFPDSVIVFDETLAASGITNDRASGVITLGGAPFQRRFLVSFGAVVSPNKADAFYSLVNNTINKLSPVTGYTQKKSTTESVHVSWIFDPVRSGVVKIYMSDDFEATVRNTKTMLLGATTGSVHLTVTEL